MSRKDIKLKRVLVHTPLGDKELIFNAIADKKVDVCCLECKYNNLCANIPNPTKMDDPNSSFLDFCAGIYPDGPTTEDNCASGLAQSLSQSSLDVEVSLEEEDRLVCYVPQNGTIERFFTELGKTDLIYGLLKKDIYVSLSEIIDCVCPGWCDLYTKDHLKCNCTSKMCLLNSVILNNKNGNGE